MRPIGYYVHHHGIGHWQRAQGLARHLRRPCVLLGTFPADRASPYELVPLSDDAPLRDNDPPSSFTAAHYAPLHHDGLRRRTALIAAWIAQARPAIMVVDVSVEVALLARLCATPCLYFRLAGRRDDAPHLTAFHAAEALIAPFPALLDPQEGWVREKTFHAGFLAERPEAAPASGGGITIVFGRGGPGGDRAALVAAARSVPGRRWRVIGPVSGGEESLPENLELLGWREDAVALLAGADIVIGGGGDGVVSEVAALGKRFLCLPEPRPFDEQRDKAMGLRALKAAVVRESWPAAGDWPDLLREVEALDPSHIQALHNAGALAQTAAFIDAAADRYDQ